MLKILKKTKSHFNEIYILEDTKMSCFPIFPEISRSEVRLTDSDSVTA